MVSERDTCGCTESDAQSPWTTACFRERRTSAASPPPRSLHSPPLFLLWGVNYWSFQEVAILVANFKIFIHLTFHTIIASYYVCLVRYDRYKFFKFQVSYEHFYLLQGLLQFLFWNTWHFGHVARFSELMLP